MQRQCVVVVLLAALWAGNPVAAQERLDRTDLTRLVAESIRFALESPRLSSAWSEADTAFVLDTTTTYSRLRATPLSANADFTSGLNVGRPLKLSSRDKLLSCPTEDLSASCAFTAANVTVVWIGSIRRVDGERISLMLHIMAPDESSRIRGQSVEMYVRKGVDGRWSASLTGRVVAG